MKTNHTSLITFACCTLLAAAGCKPSVRENSVITLSNRGREIHLIADRPATFAKTEEDKFVLHLTDHRIVIDREQVLVNEKEAAKVPTGAKKFDVTVSGGALTVIADGVEILKAPLGK